MHSQIDGRISLYAWEWGAKGFGLTKPGRVTWINGSSSHYIHISILLVMWM